MRAYVCDHETMPPGYSGFMDNDISRTKKDHGTKKKSPFQHQTLEKHYSDEKYPAHKAMEEYATSLNLTLKQIRTWFVERRRKERRENRVCGCNKGLLGGKNKCGSIMSGKKMNVNTALDSGILHSHRDSQRVPKRGKKQHSCKRKFQDKRRPLIKRRKVIF